MYVNISRIKMCEHIFTYNIDATLSQHCRLSACQHIEKHTGDKIRRAAIRKRNRKIELKLSYISSLCS